jgi:hypothetical protein
MSPEFRKSKRRHVHHGARIMNNDGSALGECVMADLSATGARLQVKQPATLPDEFILLLSHRTIAPKVFCNMARGNRGRR